MVGLGHRKDPGSSSSEHKNPLKHLGHSKSEAGHSKTPTHGQSEHDDAKESKFHIHKKEPQAKDEPSAKKLNKVQRNKDKNNKKQFKVGRTRAPQNWFLGNTKLTPDHDKCKWVFVYAEFRGPKLPRGGADWLCPIVRYKNTPLDMFCLALPGGDVSGNEKITDAAFRILTEKTGLDMEIPSSEETPEQAKAATKPRFYIRNVSPATIRDTTSAAVECVVSVLVKFNEAPPVSAVQIKKIEEPQTDADDKESKKQLHAKFEVIPSDTKTSKSEKMEYVPTRSLRGNVHLLAEHYKGLPETQLESFLSRCGIPAPRKTPNRRAKDAPPHEGKEAGEKKHHKKHDQESGESHEKKEAGDKKHHKKHDNESDEHHKKHDNESDEHHKKHDNESDEHHKKHDNESGESHKEASSDTHK